MQPLQEVPDWVHRGIVFGILLYFALFLYAEYANDPLAQLAANFVFAFVALGVGIVLYTYADRPLSPVGGAGLCLLIGGIVQLLAVILGDLLLNAVATLAVFAGIGLYIFAVWVES